MAIKQTRPTPDEAYLLLSQGFSADDIAKIAVKGDLDRALTAARKKSGVQPGQEKQFAESESRKGLGELLSTVAPYLAGAGMASLASKLPIGRIAQQVMSVPLAATGGAGAEAGVLGLKGELGEPGAGERVIMQGLGQAALQSIPAVTQSGGIGLQRLRGAMRGRAVKQAVGQFRREYSAKDITAELEAEMKRRAIESFRAGARTRKSLAVQQAEESKRTAVEAYKAGTKAADISPLVKQEVGAAEAGMKEAGIKVRNTLSASPQQVTRKEIIDDAVKAWEAKWPSPPSPEARARFAKQVNERISEVYEAYTLGGINPNKIAFTPLEANIGKQAFGQQSRAAFGKMDRGILPNPDLDRFIGPAFKRTIELKVPDIQALNKTSQTALLRYQGMKQLEASLPAPEIAALRQQGDIAAIEAKAGVAAQSAERKLAASQQAGEGLVAERADIGAQSALRRAELKKTAQERLVEQRVLAARSANPLAIYRAIPTRGEVALPGVTVKPGMVSELGGKAGDILASPLAYWSTFVLPRLLAAGERIGRP